MAGAATSVADVTSRSFSCVICSLSLVADSSCVRHWRRLSRTCTISRLARSRIIGTCAMALVSSSRSVGIDSAPICAGDVPSVKPRSSSSS